MAAKPMPARIRQAVYDRAEGLCEVMIPKVCDFRGCQYHHRKMRSQGGEHSEENGLWACRSCHSYIHLNPAWSYERGLLIHGWDEVSWPPDYYRGIERKEGDDEPESDGVGDGTRASAESW